MSADRFRPDRHGQARYRGAGVRGRNPIRTAVVDLGLAIEALQRAREHLEQVAGADDRRARAAGLTAAREQAGLGQRFARDVVRHVLGGARPKRRPVAPVVVQLRLKLGR